MEVASIFLKRLFRSAIFVWVGILILSGNGVTAVDPQQAVPELESDRQHSTIDKPTRGDIGQMFPGFAVKVLAVEKQQDDHNNNEDKIAAKMRQRYQSQLQASEELASAEAGETDPDTPAPAAATMQGETAVASSAGTDRQADAGKGDVSGLITESSYPGDDDGGIKDYSRIAPAPATAKRSHNITLAKNQPRGGGVAGNLQSDGATAGAATKIEADLGKTDNKTVRGKTATKSVFPGSQKLESQFYDESEFRLLEYEGVYLRPSNLAIGRSDRHGPVRQSSPLDLRGAVLLALNRHPLILENINEIAEKKAATKIRKADYYPIVSAGFSAGHQTDPGTQHLFTVSLTQMIYDFGRVGGTVDEYEHNVREKQALLLQNIDQISLDVLESLVNISRNGSILEINRKKEQALQEVVEITKLRSESGVASKTDIMQARTRLEDAQASILSVESTLSQWRQKLTKLLGFNHPSVAEDFDETILMQAIERSNNADFRKHPKILINMARYMASKANLEVQKAGFYPVFTLEGGYRHVLNYDDYSEEDRLNEDENSHNIMVATSMPLFQGGRVVASVTAAKQLIRARKASIRDTLRDSYERERLLVTKMKSDKARLEVLRQRKATITTTNELYRDQYRVGNRSVLDLLNSEEEKYQAMITEEENYYDLLLSYFRVLEARAMLREVLGLHGAVIQGVSIEK
ncbi:TolC family protein [Desulforhopalus singaporensis]|uniref:Type I secretion outer membrane protein, TolC family n=1 Tax=Desulforhopalus singaporensis TaxID=91360 RepID=A0A1H0R6F2_9BACT|nr:TolC family protein [Desulforhopalus singaporensis]SDP24995.1 type I secretion outer membrane protein, TolC family [Desulforhopalus singaporensis]